MVSFGNQGKWLGARKKISPSIYRELSSGGDVWWKTVEAQRVAKITANGVMTSLVSFAGTNGALPVALTVGRDRNYYGTTVSGGIDDAYYGLGTVFKVTTNGTLTMLAKFVGTNGMYPGSPLTLGPDGNFYGITAQGGTDGCGVIYRIRIPGKDVHVTIDRDGTGGLFLRYTGLPSATYRLQRAASVTGPWVNLSTNTASDSGLVEYHEMAPPTGHAFYRTVQP
jgi:uncharacterized repeat protein (TIGR03803 family)